MFLSRASISLCMAPFDRAVGHGSVSVDGDVGRDNFVEKLWALFHSHGKLVRAGLADQPSDNVTDGKGADSKIGFGGGDSSRREVGAEDLFRDVGSGESPKGFPHTLTWVSVKFSHPHPTPVPPATRTRGSVGGREFDGEQELAEEALLVFFGEGEGLGVTVLRFRLGTEFGPVYLDVGSGGHSADALDQLSCSPSVRVFHS